MSEPRAVAEIEADLAEAREQLAYWETGNGRSFHAHQMWVDIVIEYEQELAEATR